jgi:hypothetical protein
MKTARFVLAGLAAVMILVGDCKEGEARGRLFGRHGRRNCTPAAATAASAPAGAKPTTTDVICPVQKTPYYAGRTNDVDYYMFYAYPYPLCTGQPQPLYLPADSPVGCTGTSPPCFNPNKDNDHPHLGTKGHRLTEGQLKGFGEPVGRFQIDIGTAENPDPRNIDFYQLDVPRTGPGNPRPTEEVWIGIQNRYGSYGPPLAKYTVGDWPYHPYGRTVTFPHSRRPYYVLLVDPTHKP